MKSIIDDVLAIAVLVIWLGPMANLLLHALFFLLGLNILTALSVTQIIYSVIWTVLLFIVLARMSEL